MHGQQNIKKLGSDLELWGHLTTFIDTYQDSSKERDHKNLLRCVSFFLYKTQIPHRTR